MLWTSYKLVNFKAQSCATLTRFETIFCTFLWKYESVERIDAELVLIHDKLTSFPSRLHKGFTLNRSLWSVLQKSWILHTSPQWLLCNSSASTLNFPYFTCQTHISALLWWELWQYMCVVQSHVDFLSVFRTFKTPINTLEDLQLKIKLEMSYSLELCSGVVLLLWLVSGKGFAWLKFMKQLVTYNVALTCSYQKPVWLLYNQLYLHMSL